MHAWNRLASAIALVTLVGCSNGRNDPSALCAQADDHLRQCLGTTPALGPACDPAVAEAALARSCEELTDAGKADLFGDLFCRLGYLYTCAQPRCEAPALADESSCSSYIDAGGCGSCDYYLCRESARSESCGDDGYYLGFVRRYCQLFTEYTAPRLSPAGQQWIADVRPCLQRAMEPVGDDVSCEEVKEIGYAAHPGCYIETGFCELPITDMIAILKTVAPQDLGTQPFTTAIGCIGRWFDPNGGLTEEGEDEVERELEEWDESERFDRRF